MSHNLCLKEIRRLSRKNKRLVKTANGMAEVFGKISLYGFSDGGTFETFAKAQREAKLALAEWDGIKDAFLDGKEGK